MKFKTVLALLRTPHFLSHLRLMGDLKTCVRLNFLYAALETGLLKHLEEPASREQLTARINPARPDVLELLLALGVLLGELSVQNDLYRIAGIRSRGLAGESGDPFAAVLQEHVGYHGWVYQGLARWMYGGPPGDYLAETAPLVARSSRAFEPFLKDFVRDVVTGRKPRTILEVGCGSGIYLRHAAEACPDLTGVGIDMQETVVEQATDNLTAWELAGRFKILTADIRRQHPEIIGPFDLISLYNNLYYFQPDERPALFSRIRSMLTPGGTLALVSMMQGNTLNAVHFDIILRSTAGCAPLPGLQETVGMLKSCGFSEVKTVGILPSEHYYGILAR